jgi:hypothetical protein
MVASNAASLAVVALVADDIADWRTVVAVAGVAAVTLAAWELIARPGCEA